MAKKKRIPERKRLAAIFASFAVLLTGATSLLRSMSLDYYSVLGTLQKAIPAGIILGCLGWVMGMILDRPQKIHKISYNQIFINDVMKNNAGDSSNSESSETSEDSSSGDTQEEAINTSSNEG